jgi:glycerophosphoryl diester phosphodiesterase
MCPRWGPTIDTVELIWHRANTPTDLEAFLSSRVRWVECDVRIDREGVVRVGHEPLTGGEGRSQMRLVEWLDLVRASGRAIKIDLKEDGPVLDQALGAIVGFQDADLWFNAAIEVPRGEIGFRRLAGAHPGARVSCPIDTLLPYLLFAGSAAYPILDLLATWGVNRLSVGVCVEEAETFVRGAHDRGWPIDIWDVENEDDLERALLMGPESITADLGAINHLPQSKQATAGPSALAR